MVALVRVTDETHATLSMQDIGAKAVEAYRRQHVLETSNAAYATLSADPHAWQEMLDERAVWDVALVDGLADDE